jgi:hypothetical protein
MRFFRRSVRGGAAGGGGRGAVGAGARVSLGGGRVIAMGGCLRSFRLVGGEGGAWCGGRVSVEVRRGGGL